MTIAGFTFACYYFGYCELNLKLIYGLLAVFSFLSQVLSYNNYATFEMDLKDKSKQFDKKFAGINVEFLFYISSFFFITTVIFSLLVSYVSAIVFILLMVLWGLYTHPVIMLKKGRFVPYILDMLTMPFLAMFGAYLAGPITVQAVMFSMFFGFTEIAGHINHITMDYETDKNTGVVTLAVKKGPKFTFIVSLFFFALATMYFLFLSFAGLFPIYIGVLYLPGFILQFTAALSTLRRGFKPEYSARFRTMYRMIYLVESIIVELYLIINIHIFFIN